MTNGGAGGPHLLRLLPSPPPDSILCCSQHMHSNKQWHLQGPPRHFPSAEPCYYWGSNVHHECQTVDACPGARGGWQSVTAIIVWQELGGRKRESPRVEEPTSRVTGSKTLQKPSEYSGVVSLFLVPHPCGPTRQTCRLLWEKATLPSCMTQVMNPLLPSH